MIWNIYVGDVKNFQYLLTQSHLYLFRGESSTIPSSLHVNHFLKFTLSVTFIPPYTFIRYLKSIRRKIRIFRAATKWLLFGRQNTVRNGLKRTYDLFLPQDWHPDGIPREKWEKSITVCLHSDKKFENSNRKLYLFSKTTDYGHMMAKSLILFCPNSNPNHKKTCRKRPAYNYRCSWKYMFVIFCKNYSHGNLEAQNCLFSEWEYLIKIDQCDVC